MKKSLSMNKKDVIQAIIISLLLAMVVNTFVFQIYWIPSESMYPSIKKNDFVLVTKYDYWFEEPDYGEIIVFEYPVDRNKHFIKRLIGKPNDIIQIKDGFLYRNEVKVKEFYLPQDIEMKPYGPVEIPEDQYFFLGDNRNNSNDSRFWGFVERKLIEGKGDYVIWPLDRFGGF